MTLNIYIYIYIYICVGVCVCVCVCVSVLRVDGGDAAGGGAIHELALQLRRLLPPLLLAHLRKLCA